MQSLPIMSLSSGWVMVSLKSGSKNWIRLWRAQIPSTSFDIRRTFASSGMPRNLSMRFQTISGQGNVLRGTRRCVPGMFACSSTKCPISPQSSISTTSISTSFKIPDRPIISIPRLAYFFCRLKSRAKKLWKIAISIDDGGFKFAF